MIAIHDETAIDVPAREALLDRAMGPARFLKPSERLRRGRRPADGLALLARDGHRLLGSVRLWHVEAGGRPALLLGPLAVAPEAQGKGAGSALIHAAIARADTLGHRGIILVGDPEYYDRFGFVADLTTGLIMPAPVQRRRFLGLELAPGALAGALGKVAPAGTPLRGSSLSLAA